MALDYSNPPQSWAQTYWAEGPGTITHFNRNGGSNENQREYGVDPWGRSAVLWKGYPDGTTYGGDGGWSTDSITIDPNYLYRFSCWFRRTIIGSNGKAYFGAHGYGSTAGLYRYSGALDTNPYFWIASPYAVSNQMPENEWLLVIGHVFPYDYTLTGERSHSQSGAWKVDGTEVSAYYSPFPSDYKWHSSSTTANTRSYLFYCDTDTTPRQHMVYPRVDKIDGTEPTFQQLLRNGANRVLATNLGTFITI